MGKLTALALTRPMQVGMHADGDGLYLQVGSGGARSWIYRYTLNGKTRDLGLGSLTAIPLKRARELAAEARRLRAEGVDPVGRKHEQRATSQIAALRGMTFRQCAERLIEAHEGTWRNAKHRQQWRNTLVTYAYPVIGSLSVQDIDVALVVKTLQPIWNEKPETASRLRGRIETILDWATVAGYRLGDNPARWRGHLAHLFPARAKVRAVEHHAALPYPELPLFMASLRERTSTSARCLEFTILTAVRTAEAIGARWDEIDFEAGLWTIPAKRTKTRTQHRVPLSARATEILHLQAERRESEFVFPGAHTGRPLSNMAMLKMLALLGRDVTTHGFRSSFRDWAAEKSDFPNHVVEQALAHVIGNAVEAAYRRGDLFEKRRKLMDAWSAFCTKPAPVGEVVSIARAV